MSTERTEVALDICLREMELVGSGASQVRATCIGVVGLLLSIDTLLLNQALQRGIQGWKLGFGLLALLVVS